MGIHRGLGLIPLAPKVHFGRSQVVQGLMYASVIVEVQVLANAEARLSRRQVVVKVYFLVFQATLQTFGKDVIGGAALAVHADLNFGLLQKAQILRAGKLATLVAVEDDRFGPRKGSANGS